MGSCLSVVNDTSNDWYCRVGPDEEALAIANAIIIAISALGVLIATAGAAAPLVAALAANGVVAVFGVTTNALMAVTGVAAAASGVAIKAATMSGFGVGIALVVNEHFIDKGYTKIPAGERHQWGAMSLSLWQQSRCVRTYVVNATTVRTEALYMRPIFSGSYAGHDREHFIQAWINYSGVTTQDTIDAGAEIPVFLRSTA